MRPKCCDCCYPQMVNGEACGCCGGIGIATPQATANRPGLSQLAYRIGTHSSFLETMIARLSSNDFPALKGLTTRDRDDPAMALLDSWATVADVLSFYQERIANEGYLRTATERRSVLELARLVGYRLRPGVSSSVFLAYTTDENTKEEVTIPIGSQAQSVPGPDELPQSFETSEALKSRARWNNLKPRMTQPQTIESIRNEAKPTTRDDSGQPNGNSTERARRNMSESTVKGPRVYLKGINTNLKPNDPLLIDFGPKKPDMPPEIPKFGRVIDVYPDAITDRTLVTLRIEGESEDVSNSPSPEKIFDDVQLIQNLTQRPSSQPSNSLKLKRNLADQFNSKGNTGYEVASAFVPGLGETLTTAARNATATNPSPIKVYALRVRASLFGHNLPLPSCPEGIDSPNLSCCLGVSPKLLSSEEINVNHFSREIGLVVTDGVKPSHILALDAEYKEVKKGTWVAIDNGASIEVVQVDESAVTTLGGLLQGDLSFFATCPPITLTTSGSNFLGVSIGEATKMKSTILVLNEPWRDDSATNEILRKSVFYGQSEELELAEEPIEKAVSGGTDDPIELNGFYEGLESGRWVIVSGERDISGTSGVRFSELAMLASVTQDIQRESQEIDGKKSEIKLPGDKIHTFITLAEKLAYCFKRETITIYGNVVKATHGETRHEILGSGDGSKAFQTFELKQFPLTHVSASNPTGVDSTLEVLINDITWHETDSLAGLEQNDRRFITQTDNEDKTAITFGNGKEGARLPSGIENVRALYRNGIGSPGNVKANQISLLVSKPLGVKEVINPLRASGGANRENRDQARKNAPLAVKALDRLVSVQDYEDFSRVYAGIGKAHAVELSDGRRQLVHVTIAGAENIPIDETSDLFRNLRQSLHDFGDPHQPIQLAIRELMFMVISARVSILADYLWEPVATNLRKKLLDAFSFERRELGQDVVLSEVISVMQAVRGVAYVDIEAFGGIPEKKPLAKDEIGVFDRSQIKLPSDRRRLLTPDEIVLEVLDVIKRIDQHVDENAKATLRKKKGNLPIPQRLIVNLASVQNKSNRPAQLAFLSPDVPDTLILNQIT